jgi:hypothetical protein
MNATQPLPLMTKLGIVGLTAEEKWQLVSELESTLPTETESDDWERELITQRLAALEKTPGDGIPLDDFLGELRRDARGES